jgi:hypothetical protein
MNENDGEGGGGGGGEAENAAPPIRRPYSFRRNRPEPRSLYSASMRALLRRYLPKQVCTFTAKRCFAVKVYFRGKSVGSKLMLILVCV